MKKLKALLEETSTPVWISNNGGNLVIDWDEPKYVGNKWTKKYVDAAYATRLRDELERCVKALDVATQALNDINDEWCKHPDLRFKTSPLLTRDFCGQCHSWVYVGEKTTATEALTQINKLLGGGENE
jgi:hypothetical protein